MEQTAAMTATTIEDELATLTAHLNAATARFVELAWALCDAGELVDETARFLAFRCGITVREARAYLRVGEALRELPAIRAAFARGELTFTKVRALRRVATPASEEALLELAGALTAAQLERASGPSGASPPRRRAPPTSSSTSTTTSQTTARCTCAPASRPRRERSS